MHGDVRELGKLERGHAQLPSQGQRAQAAQAGADERIVVQRHLQLLRGAAAHHPRRVRQHHLHQPGRGRGGVDRDVREHLVDERERPYVVRVRVRDEHRGQVQPVQRGKIRQAVLARAADAYARVHEHPPPPDAGGDAGSAHSGRSPEKHDLH